jgi:hypothetical protein
MNSKPYFSLRGGVFYCRNLKLGLISIYYGLIGHNFLILQRRWPVRIKLNLLLVLFAVMLGGIVIADGVLSASAKTKGSTENQSNIVQTKTSQEDRLFAEYIRITQELERLNEELRSPERIESKIKLSAPEKDPSVYFKELQKRKEVLQKRLDQVLKKHPPPERADYEIMEPRPFRIVDGIMRTRESHLQDLINALKARCPDLLFGQVQASGFKQYHVSHSEGGFGSIIFWPLSDNPTPAPSDTFMGDWSGEKGAQFFGQLITHSTSGWDEIFDITMAGILQFTLPAPDCSSVVYWGTTGRVRKQGPWVFGSDWGRIKTEWALRESPEGRGFTEYFRPFFATFNDGIWGHTNYPESSWITSDSQNFNRSFHVRPGVESKIYLGITVNITGSGDGKIMTGFFDTVDFGHGINFVMVPE